MLGDRRDTEVGCSDRDMRRIVSHTRICRVEKDDRVNNVGYQPGREIDGWVLVVCCDVVVMW